MALKSKTVLLQAQPVFKEVFVVGEKAVVFF